uniref:globoside alpha-1,3-N-acetylgalactosaminyltransferase 1-like isoform X2 n=1 Tax=Scatophagus argus TaxID=75038 RepID=UPI001ED83190|nr:globoside alpha-1,3-N-acetylgalactosaminyltransferase 1-like isoform X2 [Scatophagus argus]
MSSLGGERQHVDPVRPTADCTRSRTNRLWIRTGQSAAMYNMFNNKPASVILLSVLLLGVLYMYIYQSSRAVSFEQQVMATYGRSAEVHVETHGLHLVAPDHLQYQQPSIVKGIYKAKNITVAATVFAVGKYIMFLKNFLETAEQHFFVGFNVHIYVFTDRPGEVPQVKMAAGRQLTVRSVPSSNRWQEISAGRMEIIQVLIEEELRNHVDYIFCLDVDCQFHGQWGTESLGNLLTVIHPGYYLDDRSKFPYERRPQSRAYIASGEGDFYYCAAVFGGLIEEVHLLTKTCRANFEADAKEGIEAAWQDESHLNRYMWINKPTKLLSPEYLWQDFKPQNPEIHIIRFSAVIKNYTEIRPNV